MRSGFTRLPRRRRGAHPSAEPTPGPRRLGSWRGDRPRPVAFGPFGRRPANAEKTRRAPVLRRDRLTTPLTRPSRTLRDGLEFDKVLSRSTSSTSGHNAPDLLEPPRARPLTERRPGGAGAGAGAGHRRSLLRTVQQCVSFVPNLEWTPSVLYCALRWCARTASSRWLGWTLLRPARPSSLPTMGQTNQHPRPNLDGRWADSLRRGEQHGGSFA